MEKRDYYEILGVGRTATEVEVKSSYRKLAMRYHPDRNPDDADAEVKFREAAEAYEVLANADTRARYDRLGHQGVQGGRDFHNFTNINDIFSAFGGSIFEELFNQGRGRTAGAVWGQPGSDLRVRLPLTLEEIAAGVEKKITVRKMIDCAACNGNGAATPEGITTCLQCGGSGEMRQMSRSLFGQFINVTHCDRCGGEGRMVTDPCSVCNGEGRVQGEATETIDVPAGVSDGNYIPLRGRGNAGRHGGAPGDMIILIEEREHPQFIRNGSDVVYDLRISFPQAALGADVEVPTLGGSAVLTIDPGTQASSLLRLRERGIPDLNSHRRGDQIVRVSIHVPTKLSSEEEEVLRQLADMPNIIAQNAAESRQNGDGKQGFFSRVKGAFS